MNPTLSTFSPYPHSSDLSLGRGKKDSSRTGLHQYCSGFRWQSLPGIDKIAVLLPTAALTAAVRGDIKTLFSALTQAARGDISASLPTFGNFGWNTVMYWPKCLLQLAVLDKIVGNVCPTTSHCHKKNAPDLLFMMKWAFQTSRMLRQFWNTSVMTETSESYAMRLLIIICTH